MSWSVDGLMAEEVTGVFDARLIKLEEDRVEKKCIFFVTDRRLVFAIIEGLNPWAVLVVILAFAASLVAFTLRDLTLFLVSLIVAFAAVFFYVLADFSVRSRRKRRVKRLAPDEILNVSERNFELLYGDIVKIKHEAVERYEPGSSHIFVPTLGLSSITHVIKLGTQRGEYNLLVSKNQAVRFFELMNLFVPGKIEENQT